MLKLSKIRLIGVAALLLIPSLGYPQVSAQTGSIKGMRHANSLDTSWLFVKLRNVSTEEEIETKTDGKGLFQFDNLEPGRYILTSSRPGIDRIISVVDVLPGKTTDVHLFALPHNEFNANAAIDKFIASSSDQGGAYPGGNISYLNLNDAQDHWFMWFYFVILGLLSLTVSIGTGWFISSFVIGTILPGPRGLFLKIGFRELRFSFHSSMRCMWLNG